MINNIKYNKFIKLEKLYKEKFTKKFPNFIYINLTTLLKNKKIFIQYNCGNEEHQTKMLEPRILNKKYNLSCKNCKILKDVEWFKNSFPQAIFHSSEVAKQTSKSENRLIITYNCGNLNHKIMSVNISELKIKHKKRYLSCTDCQSFPTENIVKHNFESIFDVKFNKIRPKFLKSLDSNSNLELDGYAIYNKNNKNYALAFEYQGEQHYEIRRRSNSQTDKDLIEQFSKIQNNDRLKVSRCKENNINLFIIPYTATKPLSGIKDYILNMSNKMNIPLKENIPDFDIQSIGLISHSKIYLEKLKKNCAKNNVKVLSDNYINNLTEILFECQNNNCPHLQHCIDKFTWYAKPIYMLKKRGCKKCSKQYFDIDDLKFKISKENFSLIKLNKYKSDFLNPKSIKNKEKCFADIKCNVCNNKIFSFSVSKILKSKNYCKNFCKRKIND